MSLRVDQNTETTAALFRLGPLSTSAISSVRARLAHKMAHSKTAAWRWPGGESLEVWKRRNIFLRAATSFAPTMLDELRAHQPLAHKAAAAMQDVQWIRSRGITWRNLDKHVSIMHERRNAVDHNPWLDGLTDPEKRRHVFDLHEALPAWARRWHMMMPQDSNFIDHWVLETAFANLRDATEDEPAQLHQLDFGFASVRYAPINAFEVEPWSGDEPPNEWRDRWLRRFDSYLRDHLDEGQRQLAAGDLDPVPILRSENIAHLQRAARWQVGSEDWSTFLEREKLIDRKASNVRDKIRHALDLIGIIERPGMRSV